MLRVHLAAQLTFSSQKPIDQVPRCVDPKKKATRKKYKGWTTLSEESHSKIYTLGSSSTLCGNGRAQLRQLFFACGLRFCGAIKAVLHLKFITVG
jgi:hypothetical protein